MFNLSPEERLKYWRDFRIDLTQYDMLQCLSKVAELWATAPISSQYLAYDLPETWPTAWELINDNCYDDVGTSLGIFYTLLYSEIFDKNAIIYNVLKTPTGIISNVVIDDYVLNYDFGKVTRKEDIDFPTIFRYNYKNIK